MTEQRKTRALAAIGALLVLGAVQWYFFQDVESLERLTGPVKQWVEGMSYAPSLNQMLGGYFLLGVILLAAAAARHKRIRTRKDNE